MTRHLIGFLCVCALGLIPMVGCSDGDGTGGSGGTAGDGGTGGMPECESAEDCDDREECTTGTCASGMCEYAPLEDGTACDEANECTVGMCGDGTCDATPVQDGTVCGDGAGTCQTGSCTGTFACTEQGILDAIAVGGGPHTFDCDGPQTVVTEAEIEIDHDVILDGQGNLTVDGDDDHGVFSVPQGVTVELHGLAATGSGGSQPGIFNDGELTMTNSAALENAIGIFNLRSLTLTNSTVSANVSSTNAGILNFKGTVTIANSTVSANIGITAGIWNCGGTVTIANSTVSDSVWTDSGNDCPGSDVITIANSVVDGDCAGEITSNGHNIESPGDTCGFDPNGTDQFDASAEDLKLGPLQDNGGPTMTHALLPGSVAIDAIPETECLDAEGQPLATDQRGVERPQGAACDVGAVEMEVAP